MFNIRMPAIRMPVDYGKANREGGNSRSQILRNLYLRMAFVGPRTGFWEE